jgi:hypothetical protein
MVAAWKGDTLKTAAVMIATLAQPRSERARTLSMSAFRQPGRHCPLNPSLFDPKTAIGSRSVPKKLSAPNAACHKLSRQANSRPASRPVCLPLPSLAVCL